MYKEGKITENAILHVIIPGTDWNNKIINSFYKSRVRKTLKELKSINSNSEDLIGVINQALAGKLWWNRITR
jgi:vacuolar-type H+-ATPase subunit D/Vma8